MRVKIKKTNEVKDVYSIKRQNGRVFLKFAEKEKSYPYLERNIEILDNRKEKAEKGQPIFKVYKYVKKCHRCHEDTTIYTYIIYSDGSGETVEFSRNPDKFKVDQKTLANLLVPGIEYYGLKVIGTDKKMDQVMMKMYPNKIRVKYCSMQEKKYPMNICNHCGAGQSCYFVCCDINEAIKGQRKIFVEKTFRL